MGRIASHLVGMTEASLLLACTLAPRFGLVTFASRGTEIFHEIVAGYGLTSRLAGVAGIKATPYDMLAAGLCHEQRPGRHQCDQLCADCRTLCAGQRLSLIHI